ncbi:hypothetical protein ACNBFH_004441 [Salmonella enterica subsp. enterica serovar Bareilly]
MNNAQLTLSGRINSDPVERQTSGGNLMATAFAAAQFPTNNGCEYLNVSVVAFGDLADDLLLHHRGDNVTVYGDLTPTSYVKNGEVIKALTLTLGGIQSARCKRRRPQRPQAGETPHRGADAQGQGQNPRHGAAAPQNNSDRYPRYQNGNSGNTKGNGQWHRR